MLYTPVGVFLSVPVPQGRLRFLQDINWSGDTLGILCAECRRNRWPLHSTEDIRLQGLNTARRQLTIELGLDAEPMPNGSTDAANAEKHTRTPTHGSCGSLQKSIIRRSPDAE